MCLISIDTISTEQIIVISVQGLFPWYGLPAGVIRRG